ncbi:MAG TPA: PRC-barrel domain-containing protein [Allosphingosinicella sp.]|jgi:hypothetical protein
MADQGRDDSDARQGESRGFFGGGWGGHGAGTRESRGYPDDRARGWRGDDSTVYYERDERGGRAGQGREGGWGRGAGSRGEHPDDQRVHRNRGSSSEASRNRGPDAGRERDFGHDDRHRGLPIEETSRLIASNKVEGTPVYSRDRHRLGTIYNFMVDKISGQAEYAVLRYGGFMGVGQRYYPLPWRVLTYHRDAGGYVIDMTARDFESAPSFDRTDEPEFDHDYGRRVHSWYGLEY